VFNVVVVVVEQKQVSERIVVERATTHRSTTTQSAMHKPNLLPKAEYTLVLTIELRNA